MGVICLIITSCVNIGIKKEPKKIRVKDRLVDVLEEDGEIRIYAITSNDDGERSFKQLKDDCFAFSNDFGGEVISSDFQFSNDGDPSRCYCFIYKEKNLNGSTFMGWLRVIILLSKP